MNVHFEMRDGCGIIAGSGALNAANVDAFRNQFSRWLSENEALQHIVLDLHEVDFMDSAGLGALIALLKLVSERGGNVKIARLQKQVRTVFEITRAYRVFDVFDSVDEAIRNRT